MANFIDIHTHQPNQHPESIICLLNIMLHKQNTLNGQLVSAGWHPWFISNFSISEIEMSLTNAVVSPKIVAIGECGLDRISKTDFAFQIQVFITHLEIAEKFQKPLIVHCVRAYSDLLFLLKKYKVSQKIVIHDYRGNKHQLKELQKFNTSFSFGKSLFTNTPKLIEIFQSIPMSNLFLETDDSTLSIENIYIRAAKILSVDLDFLKTQLENNFKRQIYDGMAR